MGNGPGRYPMSILHESRACFFRRYLPVLACCVLSMFVGIDLDALEQQCHCLLGLAAPMDGTLSVEESEGEDHPELGSCLLSQRLEQRIHFDVKLPIQTLWDHSHSIIPANQGSGPRWMSRTRCEHAHRNGLGAPLLC